MGRLIYTLNVSLDGFVEDGRSLARLGNRRRRAPGSATRHARAGRHDLRASAVRGDGGLLADRRVRSRGHRADARVRPDLERDAEVVFSTTLPTVRWNSRLVRGDVAEELARLRQEFRGDLGVGGPPWPPSSSGEASSMNTGWSSTRWSSVRGPPTSAARRPDAPPPDRDADVRIRHRLPRLRGGPLRVAKEPATWILNPSTRTRRR